MAKRAKRKAHSEWCWWWIYKSGHPSALISFQTRKPTGCESVCEGQWVRCRVTEILPTPKRKAKR